MTAAPAVGTVSDIVRWAFRPPGPEAVVDILDELHTLLRDRQVDLDVVLQRIVDESVRRLAADRGTLFLVDHLGGELVSQVGHLPELSEIRLRMGEGVAGWVAETGNTVNVPVGTRDVRFTDRIDELTGYRTRSLLAVPVSNADGAPIGVFQLLNKRGGVFQRADEVQLVELAARVAGLLAESSLGSQLRRESAHRLAFRFNHIVGDSPVMRAVYARTERAARTDATVLVRGESGAGKELIARAVHDNSKRSERPFVVVDLAALPHHLIENELFGHKRGAYTGANKDASGRVAEAEGGTLFLDEVGDLPLPVQAKLLRLVQERSYFPVGGTKPLQADVRFVCATHRPLAEMVRDGRFRQDLYYRLRVVEIVVPPLRERGSADLDRLIDHFLYTLGKRHERQGQRLAAAARERLHRHDWPGNVRELQHCIESAVVMAPDDLIGPAVLPLDALDPPASALAAGASLHSAPASLDPSSLAPFSSLGAEAGADDRGFATDVRPLREVEAEYVRWVVDRCGGNKSEAARLLGIGRNTLNRKLG